MLVVSNGYNTLKMILESKLSDDYEIAIADSINTLSKDKSYIAERCGSNNKCSDILITRNDGVSSWLEVKMDHHAGLGSPRVYYSDYEGGWCTTYKTPAAQFAVNLLNSSDEAFKWIKQLKKWICTELESSRDDRLLTTVCRHKSDSNYTPCDLKIVLPTTAGGLKLKGAIPVDVIRRFTSDHDRKIITHRCDITSVVESHYLDGKSKPAHYIQIGDDLYRVGEADPFNWKVPKLSINDGSITARISIRDDKLYEIQIDIKSHSHSSSDYSLKLDSKKLRPF